MAPQTTRPGFIECAGCIPATRLLTQAAKTPQVTDDGTIHELKAVCVNQGGDTGTKPEARMSIVAVFADGEARGGEKTVSLPTGILHVKALNRTVYCRHALIGAVDQKIQDLTAEKTTGHF